MSKTAINIVWFKRDLRFTDHEPLFLSQQQNLPILFIYFFEPSVMSYHDSDIRHWRFVYESLLEMNIKLKTLNAQIHLFHNEVETVFNELVKHYNIKTVFSHQEVGNKLTYDRDISMQHFFKSHSIEWNECLNVWFASPFDYSHDTGKADLHRFVADQHINALFIPLIYPDTVKSRR